MYFWILLFLFIVQHVMTLLYFNVNFDLFEFYFNDIYVSI